MIKRQLVTGLGALVLALSSSLTWADTSTQLSPAQQFVSANSSSVNNQVVTSENVWNVIAANLHLSPLDKDSRVQHWVNYYVKHRSDLESMLNQATPYIYYIYQQTVKRHIPARYALLPIVESSYEPTAKSSVGAAGLWQLMPGTASSYGLDIDWWHDARLSVVKSTTSSLNYLQRLHSALGTWPLAAAAYNFGIGHVKAAIDHNKRLGRSTDFWSLPLPLQTQNYVPKLMALATILKDPARFGVKVPYVANKPYFKAVTITSQMDQGEIAKLAGISISTLDTLNPNMLRWATPPESKFKILLPADKVATFMTNLNKLVGQAYTTWKYYQVPQNESLQVIAQQFNTNAKLLQEVNVLPHSDVRARTGLLVPVNNGGKYTQAQSGSHATVTANVKQAQTPPAVVEKKTVIPAQENQPIAASITAQDILSRHAGISKVALPAEDNTNVQAKAALPAQANTNAPAKAVSPVQANTQATATDKQESLLKSLVEKLEG